MQQQVGIRVNHLIAILLGTPLETSTKCRGVAPGAARPVKELLAFTRLGVVQIAARWHPERLGIEGDVLHRLIRYLRRMPVAAGICVSFARLGREEWRT